MDLVFCTLTYYDGQLRDQRTPSDIQVLMTSFVSQSQHIRIFKDPKFVILPIYSIESQPPENLQFFCFSCYDFIKSAK